MVSPEQLPTNSLLRKAKENIQKIFGSEQVRLSSRFTSTTEKTIAIFGAGLAIETPALNDYFEAQGLGKPKVIAFDRDASKKSPTEQFASLYGASVDYRIADISDTHTFGDEQYDLVLIRKPDIHRSVKGWSKAFENAFDHLKEDGIIIVTTSEDEAYDFVLLELTRHGEMFLDYPIPSNLQVAPFLSENDLLMFKKGKPLFVTT